MSHIIRVKVGITNLEALSQAATCCGPLELIVQPGLHIGIDGLLYDTKTGQLFTGKGSMAFRSWETDHGRLAGDYPIPEGMSAAEVGRNAVALIRVKPGIVGADRAYEVGVIPRVTDEGRVEFDLCHDFFAGGNGIEKYVGPTKTDRQNGVVSAHPTLLKWYEAMVAKFNAARVGVSCDITENADGTLDLLLDKENLGVSQLEAY